MVQGGAADPTPPGCPSMQTPVWHPLLTVPVVADGEFLAPGAVADPVEVRPHGGREKPLQIVRIWQENSRIQWPQTSVSPKLRALSGAHHPHSPPYCPICGEEREMKESTLCSSMTDSSARHTRPPGGRMPRGWDLGTAKPTASPHAPAPSVSVRRVKPRESRHTL